jgi:hypothetical protein
VDGGRDRHFYPPPYVGGYKGCEISAPGRAIHLWSSPERIESPPLLSGLFHTIFRRMLRLTKQEQLVLCVVLSLLLVGWTVRAWRTAHPPAASNKRTK